MKRHLKLRGLNTARGFRACLIWMLFVVFEIIIWIFRAVAYCLLTVSHLFSKLWCGITHCKGAYNDDLDEHANFHKSFLNIFKFKIKEENE